MDDSRVPHAVGLSEIRTELSDVIHLLQSTLPSFPSIPLHHTLILSTVHQFIDVFGFLACHVPDLSLSASYLDFILHCYYRKATSTNRVSSLISRYLRLSIVQTVNILPFSPLPLSSSSLYLHYCLALGSFKETPCCLDTRETPSIVLSCLSVPASPVPILTFLSTPIHISAPEQYLDSTYRSVSISSVH